MNTAFTLAEGSLNLPSRKHPLKIDRLVFWYRAHGAESRPQIQSDNQPVVPVLTQTSSPQRRRLLDMQYFSFSKLFSFAMHGKNLRKKVLA